MESNTNMAYRKVRRRVNFIPTLLMAPFRGNSGPRLMLEVFLRKDFGQFYFNMGSVLRVVIVLLILPRILYWIWYDDSLHNGIFNRSFWDIYLGWHLFIIAFVIVSVIRWLETNRLSDDPSYPYNHPGKPLIRKALRLGDVSEKKIAVVYEPVLCFVVGLILLQFGQQIGFLIVINSFFYSVGNYAEFWDAEEAIKEREYELQQSMTGKEIHDVYGMDTIVKKQDANPPQTYRDDSPTYVE